MKKSMGKKSKASKSSKKQMPTVSATYPSRYKKADNKTRGSIETTSPTYPSRYN